MRALHFVLIVTLGLGLWLSTTARATAPEQALSPARQTQAPTALLAITHGPLSGEVTDTAATVWARGSLTGTLKFELATTSTFSSKPVSRTIEMNDLGDFTGEARFEKLTTATTYYYRATLLAGGQTSAAATGQFTTAPAATKKAALDFVFGACLGGQGYCRDPQTGWAIFDQMAKEQPDFFLVTGDSVYVDSACPADKNVPGAEGPFKTLAGFRARYRYHLEDTPYQKFLMQTPVYVGWDDHEVLDDYGGPALSRAAAQIVQDGHQAFFEYWPVAVSNVVTDPYRLYRRISYGGHADFFILDTRSHRDPNVNWDPHPRTQKAKTMLGAEQFAWLQKELAASKATWKFIVSSVPLAYPTGFPQPEVDGYDGWANNGNRSGYETELMALLFYLSNQRIRNVVFLTGDTHWPFALSYDPDRNGEPNFYEFSSSPLSALPLAPPATPDLTFNPTVLYAEGQFQGTLFNYGQIAITAAGDLTFRIVDKGGTEHYKVTLKPQK
jgi:alkaline phosphatase D